MVTPGVVVTAMGLTVVWLHSSYRIEFTFLSGD